MKWWLAVMVALALQQSRPSTVQVVFDTELGRFTVEVDAAHAPITAANFLKYVDDGFYDGGRFHRAVRPDTELRTDFPIQVIQAGIRGARRDAPTIPLERTNTTGLKHVDGAISMARNGPDTATSDFFICIGAQPELDFGGRRNADGQGFGAFGRVVAGMDVVRKIQAAPVKDKTETLTPPIGIVKASRVRTRTQGALVDGISPRDERVELAR
jgi:peptidyl-prolyl cis-trans isomerase A (cyclophilin A)